MICKPQSTLRVAPIVAALLAQAHAVPGAMVPGATTEKKTMTQNEAQPPSLQEAGARRLEEPCRNFNARKGGLYRDPNTGRPLLVVNSCTPGFHGAAVLIDYEAGQSRVLPFPAGSGGWDMTETAPGKLLFESLSPLHLIPVDLHTGEVDEKGVVPVPQSEYAWRLIAGPQGWVYFGSYPTYHVYRYYPPTRKVEDLGRVLGPEGNLYVRQIGVTNDGWLLCSVANEKLGIVAIELATKKQHWLIDAEKETDAPALTTLDGVVYTSLGGRLKQFDAATVGLKDAVVPPAPAGLHWTSMLPSSTPQRKVLWGSDGTLYLLEDGKAPQPMWNLALRGGWVVGVDDKNRVLGIRGQDYFVASPMARSIEPKPMAPQAPPVVMHFLRADPQGGVTGGPTFGQTLFRFDAARDLLQNTPQVLDGSGEVYDGQWLHGKFYFIAYVRGDIAVWDPAQPWDQWSNINPHRLDTYHDKGLIRPIGGLVVGPGGRLYGGWSGKYGVAGGGLTEYDIATGKSRVWSNEIFAPAMSIGKIAADEKYVYGVTSNYFSGIQRPHKPLVFWVFDPATEQVVWKQPLEDTSTSVVVCVPTTGHIWLAGAHGLRRFSPQKLAWAETLAWPKQAGEVKSVGICDAQGASAWFAFDKVVARLDDGPTPIARVLFAAPETIHAMAAGNDGNLYFSQRTALYAAPLHP